MEFLLKRCNDALYRRSGTGKEHALSVEAEDAVAAADAFVRWIKARRARYALRSARCDDDGPGPRASATFRE